MAICNGDCDCHPKPARACPCEDAVNACLARGKMPNCENKAYIPWITLPNLDAAKNVFNSLVQISENNTLYYIGCDQRVTKLVANPVEIDNYDLENNPNNLRSQFVIDFANNRGAYYNETGEYQIFYFGEHGGGDDSVRLTVNYSTNKSDWSGEVSGPQLLPYAENDVSVTTFFNRRNIVTFTDQSTSETLTLLDVIDILNSGKKVILDNVPIGMYYTTLDRDTLNFGMTADGVELGLKSTQTEFGQTFTTYGGDVPAIRLMEDDSQLITDLSVFIIHYSSQGLASFAVQGFSIEESPQ